MKQRVTVRVPAKVNIHLSVGPLRADGFHDLATVYHAVSLFDDVMVERSEPGSGVQIFVDGSFIDQVPADQSNLAVAAAKLVANRYGVPADFIITVTKSIPVAAGLAGGSADAAGALVATDALLGGSLARTELLELAAELGSDVPFSLTGGTAIGVGRGERLSPALTQGVLHWVLVASRTAGLSTPAVYAELDRLREGSDVATPTIPDALMQALRSCDAMTLGSLLANDLQRAALSLRSSLSRTIDVSMDYGALGAVVSGSGPTIAILVRDEEHALDLTVALSSHGVTDAIYRVQGPVPGARVVESS